MRKLLMSLWCSLLLLSGDLIAQTRTLTGKVIDDNGKPLANASVIVKGTRVGTITNTDGSYSLNVPVGAKTLVISSIDMQPEEIQIGGLTVYNLVLRPQEVSMDEVVVVGYNTIARRSLTGSVSKVSGEALSNKPVASFDQALTGKAAGVLVNTSSGLVGDDVIIRVRGGASVSMGGYPLIVLDGVPVTQGNQHEIYGKFNALAELNPSDIENIEVLKDASAAAIYGSRGSAGVLLITTKKGKAGTTSLNYDNYIGFNEPTRQLQVLNAPDYMATINKLKSNAGLPASAFYGDIDNDGKADTINTNWQDELFHKGLVQNHNVAISGGSASSTYFASLNYNENQGYLKPTLQKRGSARLNMTSKVTDWLQFGVNTQYSRTRMNNLGSGVGTAFSGVPSAPLTALPNIPVYSPDGNYYTGLGGNKNLSGYFTPNPVAVTQMNYEDRDAHRFIGSAFGELQLIKGLKLKSQVNVDYSSAYIDAYWNKDIGDGAGPGGVRQTNYNEKNTWSWFNTLNYNRQIGADHELNVLAGTEYTRRTAKFSYNSGYGIFNPDLLIINTANYQDVLAYDGIDGIDDGLASYFGWVNYGFRKKYLATFNFRTDADSRFGKDKRWGYFPSGSVAWRVTEEDFMRPYVFVNDLKLRASYGVTGNSNIGYFPALSTIEPDTYADIPVLSLTNPGNSALGWERHVQFDAGIDALLWKNTSFTLDYYNRKTLDLILRNPVLATLGFPDNTITENVGELQSRGIELSVATPVWHGRNFAWDINFNMAWNKTKVIATNLFGDDLYDNNDPNATYSIARPGQPLGVFYLIRWAGVNPLNGLPTFWDVNGNQKQFDKANAAMPWTLVADGSKTSGITASDRVLTNKSPYPKLYGGISQTFKYLGFDASVDLQYALGFYIYNQTRANLMAFDNSKNKLVDIQHAWTKAGDNTDVPRLYWSDNFWTKNASTRWLEKGDFLRVRNVQIGYTIPRAISERIKVNRLRFYVQGSNLYTFTGYTGIDPEANYVGETNIGLGIDKFRPYFSRTYTMGVNLGL
ncbi:MULTISPECIES: SusC/RagA family TonB-linked outer membrane protein [Niastella]|uniref:TonB-dependent receptor n=1 Tax=Niastella soli TaxID=2821487 RepID=A0ABS3YMR3_9BACT|nr:TonB-dependent receptor [Niastella soli]MBO9199184.1 TonB-dependent receptor [Niastella soli]